MKFYGYKEDERYGYKHEVGPRTEFYTYSIRTVDSIVANIRENPEGIIDDLKRARKTQRG